MSEWGAALIAAGSALAGSVVTGWFGRAAGIRQAEAARDAGARQADALLTSVRTTLAAEAGQRARALRRQTYADFLAAAESSVFAARTGRGTADDEVVLQRALSEVVLEGPDTVADAARGVVDLLRRHGSPDELRRAKDAFVGVARENVDEGGPHGR
ncbi:hypothetical protein [Streptomyces sp. VRA16 Mangrove soil]|uniref:hypothetical protein n=1 Tax=Streptomyces sp. VRA16 Mangrove soil TaxID=2817434 RepID=UPI001A9E3AD9|nr:hypothetical protein [Streptomyces sp. VRA16 Mangrove soil]MBO1329797.1 hypothetical protein [Streptomyces sp. VRA16 Mangrove soil]